MELQHRLEDAGFFPGRKDGVFGRQTRAAVYAMQKLYDLERTGVFRTEDWELLDREILGPGPAPEADRIEIDLRRQVLYLIEAEAVTGVFPISSANGESYRNSSGRLINAVTPEGRFEFGRQRNGWWESYLGFLYSPVLLLRRLRDSRLRIGPTIPGVAWLRSGRHRGHGLPANRNSRSGCRSICTAKTSAGLS